MAGRETEYGARYQDPEQEEWDENTTLTNFMEKLQEKDQDLARELAYAQERTHRPEPPVLGLREHGRPQGKPDPDIQSSDRGWGRNHDRREEDTGPPHTTSPDTPLAERPQEITDPAKRLVAAFEPTKYNAMMEPIADHLSHNMAKLREDLEEYLSSAQPWQIDERDRFEIVETNLLSIMEIERDIDQAAAGHKPEAMPATLREQFDAAADARTQALHHEFRAYMADRYSGSDNPEHVHRDNYAAVTGWEQFKEDFQEFTENHLPGDAHRLATDLAITATAETRQVLFGLAPADTAAHERYIKEITTRGQPPVP